MAGQSIHNDIHSRRQTSHRCDNTFLPDFCSIQMVLSVVIVAELLSLVLVLWSRRELAFPWDELGVVSLFVQWVALTSIALLCLSRSWLCRLRNAVAGLCSYLLVLLVTLGLSEAAFWIIHHSGLEYAPGWHLELIARNMGISAIVSAVALRLFYLQHQYRSQLEAHTNARIEALQARIRPHFLFNSMNTIAALIRQHPQHAEEAVEDLADLFRASLANGKQQVSLGSELENARRYLHIEKLRLGDRLQVEWDMEGLPLEVMLPPLILQPLLENAIYHGIERLPQGGTISVSGLVEQGRVVIIIRNPLPDDEVPDVNKGHHMAVNNIRERLRISYGMQGNLLLSRQDNDYEVRVMFPLQTPDGQ